LHDPASDARGHADAVIAALATPVRLDDALVTTQVKASESPSNKRDRRARIFFGMRDTAMYSAKTSGGQVAWLFVRAGPRQS